MNFNFSIDGLCIIKKGRKILAKIYDRDIYYPAHKIKSSYQYRFNLEIPESGGCWGCNNLDEVEKYFNKFFSDKEIIREEILTAIKS